MEGYQAINHIMQLLSREANAALLAVRLAISFDCSFLSIEGDSLVTMLAINDSLLFLEWNTEPIISDILFQLRFIPIWKALKVFRCANFSAHQIVRWVTANHVFCSIPHCFSFIYVLWFRSDNDPPL
jgi:hypothetical protein